MRTYKVYNITFLDGWKRRIIASIVFTAVSLVSVFAGAPAEASEKTPAQAARAARAETKEKAAVVARQPEVAAAYNPQARQKYKIFVDKEGVMRRSDTKEEVSYYGTNLTTPFAHAYRALGYLDVDRKKSIDRDVYHLARLGFNAFRLHLWDAELTDSAGNLIANDHLDLLDYLLAQLEKRGIDVVITAQTNFGNGYPERNIDTGAFTYDYDKCRIHEDPKAQKAQENYLRQLVGHVNPYTGRSYASDNAIIAIEINNEPCHSGTRKEVTAYINRMAKALQKSGWDKPVLYNVSHNPEVTQAYYDADIDGTTFQWYPIGLVAGHERKGNFLPYVDRYEIPWKGISGYDNKARIVYEFDPADILYSYMYPAVARTFRKEGFQWITQFAYDPTDMARFNTEYQTHFLNLAYTPAKALSMLIASEAAQRIPRGADFGSYPQNTSFGDVRVDGIADLSILNASDKYIYSRTTDEAPRSLAGLQQIAGSGSSPIVTYNGTGAYFLDKLDDYHWRLEVMPDVVLTKDPFAKPSLTREVGTIVYNTHTMRIALPSLGADFSFYAVNEGNNREGTAVEGSVDIYPGVYVLSSDPEETREKWTAQTLFGTASAAAPLGNMRLGEYVAPQPSPAIAPEVSHHPLPLSPKGKPLTVIADVTAGEAPVDSVVIYPADISFWNDRNTLIPMSRVEGRPFTWSADFEVPAWRDKAQYNIVAFSNGNAVTYPGAVPGTPLDWDAPEGRDMFTVEIVDAESPLMLLSVRSRDVNTEAGTIPDGRGAWLRTDLQSPLGADTELLTFRPEADTDVAIIRSYVAPRLSDAALTGNRDTLVIQAPGTSGVGSLQIGFVAADGTSWLAPVTLDADGKAEISLSALRPAPTDLVPAAYPTFLSRTFDATDHASKFDLSEMHYVVVRASGAPAGSNPRVAIEAIYLR